jgi:hypothetical protein
MNQNRFLKIKNCPDESGQLLGILLVNWEFDCELTGL